jgi:ribosomal-protein-alanine N-acetyltransferase
MREAAKKIIEYSFQTLGFRAIDAYTHKDNLKSTNLLQQLEFKSIDSGIQQNPDLILFRLSVSER